MDGRVKKRVECDSYDAIIAAPFGKLGIRLTGESLSCIDFFSDDTPDKAPNGPVAARAVAALQRYFQDPTSPFDVALETRGTEFQRRVWQVMRSIPPGGSETYGEVARFLGSSPRAVGGVCRANPVPIVVPCHRIVAKAGIGGFAGNVGGSWGAIKQWLLEHEARDAGH